MEKRRTKRKISSDKTYQRILTSPSDEFFNKPLVKTITKTVVIAGTVFGFLYVSKYFLNATAGMIESCKKVRDAWKS